MVHRWITVEGEKIKEFPSGKALCKKYNCSYPTLYTRIKKNNQNKKSRVFGKDILVYRLPGEFGDPIDLEDTPTYECDTCGTPVRNKDIICDNCDGV